MKLTFEEFIEAKKCFVATHGMQTRDGMTKHVQALAQLYARSGWTQEELAEVEGLHRTRITQLILFGKFLDVTQGNIIDNLNEKQFRVYWHLTDKKATNAARFAAVAQMLTDAQQKRPQIRQGSKHLGKQLVTQFADGKWHRLPEMADAVEHDQHVVKELLDRMVTQGSFKTFAEKRPGAKGTVSYRLVKGGAKKINMAAFVAESKPILDDMKSMAHGHLVHFSQQGFKLALAQLDQVIERLAR